MHTYFNDLLIENRKLLLELSSQLAKLRGNLSSFENQNTNAFNNLQVSKTNLNITEEHQADSFEERKIIQ